MRRLAAPLRDSYGFDDPAPHRQVGWRDEGQPPRRFAFFERLYKPGVRVLDVGCGNGLFYDWLVERGLRPDYWGVDGSAEFIRQFSERRPEAGARLLQADVTAPGGVFAPVLREVIGGQKPFDLAVMYGVATDFGARGEAAEAELLHAVRAVMPTLREGGALSMDFLDADEVDGLREDGVFIPGWIPPRTWKLGRVAEFFSPLAFDLHKPVVGRDFGVVAYKGDRPAAAEQGEPSRARRLAVFDFGDSLLADAREFSIERVDRAVEGVERALRGLASGVQGRIGERLMSFAPDVADVAGAAAGQLRRQWETTKREHAPVSEQIAWKFDGLPSDLESLGVDRAGKAVASAARFLERAVDGIEDAAPGMRFPQESGLVGVLQSAAVELERAWGDAERDYWNSK